MPSVTDATDAMDATDDLHTSLPIPADQPLNLNFNIPNFQHTSSDDALAVTENAPSSIPESTLDDVNNSLLPEDIIADDLEKEREVFVYLMAKRPKEFERKENPQRHNLQRTGPIAENRACLPACLFISETPGHGWGASKDEDAPSS